MCSRDDLNYILDKVCEKAKADFGSRLDSVTLYGSYARGDAAEGSDIDIMILVDMPQGELTNFRCSWNSFGTEVDLNYNVLLSFKLQETAKFYAWKDIVPFYRNVYEEGVSTVA